MNYTTHFHLPQWDKDDRIMMDDFNQMASHLENALSLSQDATQKAQQAAQAAQSAANGAQSTADTAQEAVDEVKSTVEALTVRFPRVMYGSYIGIGGYHSIKLPINPWLLIICGMENNDKGQAVTRYSGVFIRNIPAVCCEITDNGFTVSQVELEGCPQLNKVGCGYSFMAIPMF